MGCTLKEVATSSCRQSPLIRTEKSQAVIDAILYNREQLEGGLASEEVAMLTDGELLLMWLEKKGYEGLKDVVGDFAGAVYSKRNHTLTIFRDHTGVRPLYYYNKDGFFAFSKDIRGITAIPQVDTALNEKKFYQVLMGYNDLTPDETEYRYIRCVKPAHFLVVHMDREAFDMDESCYWQLGAHKIRYSTIKEYEEELYRRVEEAIDCRARAISERMGIELSGGLDSGVISILFRRLGYEGAFYSWSIDPAKLPLKEVDERRVIQDICEQENILCHYNDGVRHYSEHTFEKGLAEFEVPFINTLEMFEGAGWMKSQGAAFIFSGYGGDEGISHRAKVDELLYHHEYLAYVKAIYHQCEGKSFPILRTIKRTVTSAADAHKRFHRPFDIQEKSADYLNLDFKKHCDSMYPPEPLTFSYDPKAYILGGGSRLRMDTAAIVGMDIGVQYLFPYLDYRVMDYAVSIPRRLYTDGQMDRLIYRNAFKHIMPESLYQVDYKNMPSIVKSPEEQAKTKKLDLKDVQRWTIEKKRSYMSALDRKYWSKYLDFDKLDRLAEGEDFTLQDYKDALEAFSKLVYCAYIENVGVHIKEKFSEWI